MIKKYDITVIGAGPGGYVAALYAAQCGLKVCLIEKKDLGGVCLNTGCIPTKTYRASAELYAKIKNCEKFGITAGDVAVDFPRIIERTGGVVNKLRKGVELLLRNRKVDIKKSNAFIIDSNHVKSGDEVFETSNIIIATGSADVELENFRKDHPIVYNSRSIWKLDKVPERLAVIGGGIIGCEFASIFRSLGAQVKITEVQDRVLGGLDEELAKKITFFFKKNGIEVNTGCNLESIDNIFGNRVSLKISGCSDYDCDAVLMAVGRRPVIEGFGIDRVGIEYDRKGIKVDGSMRTAVPNIYAIGDCTGAFYLAHTASYGAIIACDNIMGKKIHADFSVVPSCVFTDPEIAFCGLTEAEAKERYSNILVSRFSFRSLGKANADGNEEGFVKLITNKDSQKILGAHIMGHSASDIISEIVLAIKKGLKAGDIADTIHAHPTMPEALSEAAHMSLGKPINSI